MKTADEIKKNKSFISMISLYDSCFASLAEEAKMDLILVGDSLANVILGMDKTTDVTVDIMKIFVEAVSRGVQQTHIIADMPFDSYRNKQDALKNASIFMEVGANSVKLEGFKPDIVQYLVEHNIPVVGHLGLLPQTATSYQKYGEDEFKTLLEESQILAMKGVFCLVLEHIKEDVATKITEQISIPTIGISCGNGTNGQVLVAYDLLGLTTEIPGFIKPVLNLREQILKSFKNYSRFDLK